MGIVTVSRQYGAGGLSVASTIAAALGYRFADREIVEQAAARVGIDRDLAEHLDERVPALVEKVGLALAAASPEFGLVAPPASDDRLLAAEVRHVLESMAAAGRVERSQGLTEGGAREACRRVDAERAGYVRRFYGVDITDPLLYDAVLNTSRLGVEGAAEAGVAVIRRRLRDAGV